MADVEVSVGANVKPLERGARDGADALKHLSDRVDDMNRRARRLNATTAKSFDRLDMFAEVAERANRVSMILGGTLGDVTGGLDDFATLIKGGAGAMTAAIAGAVALTAAVGALGVAIVRTIDGIDDLAESLDTTRRAQVAPYIATIQEADAALEGLKQEASALQIVLVSGAAPAVGEFGDTIAGLLYLTRSAVVALDDLSDSFEPGLSFAIDTSVTAMINSLGPLGQVLVVARQIQKAIADVGEEQRKLDKQAPDPTGMPAVFGVPDALRAPPESALPRGGNRPPISAPTGPLFTAEMEDAIASLDEFEAAAADVETRMQGVSIVIQDRFAHAVKMARQHVRDLAAEATEVNQLTADQQRQLVDSVGTTLTMATSAASDAVASLHESGTISAREAFEANKAIAIANAAIQIAAGIAGAWGGVNASLGAAGIALAAVQTGLIASAGAAQIALIASTSPRRHSGGLDPDERLGADGVVRLQGEAGATFSRQALDALGGRGAVDDLARTGRAGMVPEGMTIYAVIDGVERRTRLFGEPMRGAGHVGANRG